MSYQPYEVRVRHGVHPGDYVGVVTMIRCDQCGNVVADPVAHDRIDCVPVKPPKPEPLKVNAGRLTGIIDAHRIDPRPVDGLAVVRCRCGNFTGLPWNHSVHVADMIRRTLEGSTA